MLKIEGLGLSVLGLQSGDAGCEGFFSGNPGSLTPATKLFELAPMNPKPKPYLMGRGLSKLVVSRVIVRVTPFRALITASLLKSGLKNTNTLPQSSAINVYNIPGPSVILEALIFRPNHPHPETRRSEAGVRRKDLECSSEGSFRV